jgi:threonine/homoserine/homoserine lactone efflux protein
VAVFFAALFSQFIRPEATLAEQLMVASTAGAIDTMWYIIVAATLSNQMILERVKSRAALLNRCFGAILIVLSLAVLVSR